MRLSVARVLLIALGSTFVSLCANAQSEDKEIVVYSARLDHVENPDIIQQWRTILDTQEARAIGDAITSYYGCVGCYSMVGNTINQISPNNPGSEEHRGVIQAPPGYTVCRAHLVEPTSVTCNGTLTGSYRTADDPQSARMDGLHWYMVVPHPAGIGPGRCWVDAGIVWNFCSPLLEIANDEIARLAETSPSISENSCR